MAKSKKPTIMYSETYVKEKYVPSKEDVIELIKKDAVSIYILERTRYSDGSEVMKLNIKHK